MLTLAQAFAEYDKLIRPLPTEHIPLSQAQGRTLAATVSSAIELPLFTQSAVDGYAAKSADTQQPGQLNLQGEVAAGDATQPSYHARTVCRIFTGAMVPDWADTVIRQELVERLDDSTLQLNEVVASNIDIRHQGEELQPNDTLAHPGQALDAGMLAALAMTGVRQLCVFKQPTIDVLITGNEVIPPDSEEALPAGKIWDANGPLIEHWLNANGLHANYIYVEDDFDSTTAAIAKSTANVVLTTGGVSVGDHDYIPSASTAAGFSKAFWKVAQQPGKPLYVAHRQVDQAQQLLMGLPGNPAAVLVGLVCHLRYVLNRFKHLPGLEWLHGILADDVRSNAGRARLLRMRAVSHPDGSMRLHTLPKQQSHMLSNLAAASALVHIEAGSTGKAGDLVQWLPLFQPIRAAE